MAKKSVSARITPSIKTLGPVSDLERHLPPEWWKTLFNSIYLKTDGDVVENDQNTSREVDLFIQSTGSGPGDRILDLCCGQGRHCFEMAKRGFRHVVGLDRSRYLVRLARKRARLGGLPLSFHEGDARKFSFPKIQFDCVALFGNSFGYFEREDDDEAVLGAVKRALRPGGRIFLDLVDGDWMRVNFEPRSWEWIDQNHFVCRERSLASDGLRLVSREVVVHAERGVIVDQFYAERLYSRQAIDELLAKVGMEDIEYHGSIETASDRQQDLGMMAHRMFISAHTPRIGPVILKSGPPFPEVTVMQGDPRLGDSVKLGGQYNPEDFETISRMKAALGELSGYNFEFWDDHSALLSKLRHNPPAFVLNLCDEGFNNDAFLELHVPAVLEMLGVPYSGAGPSCLGMCYNKSLVRAVAISLDIPCPLESYFNPTDQAATLPSVFPALLKPNFGDSSIGITQEACVENSEQLIRYLEKLRDNLCRTVRSLSRNSSKGRSTASGSSGTRG